MHSSSSKAARITPFVAIRLWCLTGKLLESELFVIAKGSLNRTCKMNYQWFIEEKPMRHLIPYEIWGDYAIHASKMPRALQGTND